MWNQQHEQELRTMRARLQMLEADRAQAVDMVRSATVAALFPIEGLSAHDLAQLLIENADAIRDALAPFDSGVREAGPKVEIFYKPDGTLKGGTIHVPGVGGSGGGMGLGGGACNGGPSSLDAVQKYIDDPS